MIRDTSTQDEYIEKPSKMRKVKIALLCFVISGVALTLFNFGLDSVESNKSFPLSEFNTAVVFRGELTRDINVSGKLVAARAPRLFSSEPGIANLLINPGNVVEKGDVLAVIESPKLEATFAQENSRLQTLYLESERGNLTDQSLHLELESSLDNFLVKLNASEREYLRAKKGVSIQAISEMEFELREDQLSEAKLLYGYAKKRIALSKEKLTFEKKVRDLKLSQQQLLVNELERRKTSLTILAPFRGVVGNWLIGQKEHVTDSKALMTIVDLKEYEAELDVPEYYANEVNIGQPVYFSLVGKNLSGQILSVSPEVTHGQIKIKASIEHDSDTLRQNQRINARIELDKKPETLMVSRGAFLNSDNDGDVYLIRGDMALKQKTQTGIISTEYVELIDGVKPGDELIVSDYAMFLDAPQFRITR